MSITAQDLSNGFKKQPFAWSAGLLAIVLAAVAINRAPSVEERTEELDSLTRQGGQFQNNITASALLDDQLAELRTLVEGVEQRLIRPSELALNLQYFYRLESDTGTLLVDLRPGNLPARATGPNAPAYIQVPFTVGVQGRFEQLVLFLRKLERGPHFIRVTSINLAPVQPANPEVLNMTLTLQILGKS